MTRVGTARRPPRTELGDRKGVVGSAIRAVGRPCPVGSPWPRQRPDCVQSVVSSHGRALSAQRDGPVYVFTSWSACCAEKCLQEEREETQGSGQILLQRGSAGRELTGLGTREQRDGGKKLSESRRILKAELTMVTDGLL